MNRRFWLYALIVALFLANGFVFYRLLGLYLADTRTTETAQLPTPENSNQRQQVAKDREKKPTVIVPILMYHYIRDYTDESDPLGIQLSVSPAVLRKQLQNLKDEGYETISLEEFANGKTKPKSIILTFDDGSSDHYQNALPILKELQMKATFFIVTGFIGRGNYMTAQEITELKDAGMEIGGHSIDHKNLASLTYEAAYDQISSSLRSTDPVFAYPSGKYSSLTDGIIKELGVKATVTTNLGVASNQSDFTLLPRIRVKQATNILKVIAEQTYLLQNPEVNPATVDTSASQAN